MNIYFFSAGQGGSSLRFLSRLKDRLECMGKGFPQANVVEIDSGQSMTLRSGDVIILFAGTREELDAIVGKREAFAGCRVILVLPDGDRETIHKGYLIRPRFIDYKESDLNMLLAVLCKMTAAAKKACVSPLGAVDYA